MAYLSYDWQTPFRAAAISSGRQRAPERLTLEDLLALQDEFSPPPRPKALTSLADLSPEERKQVRLQGLFAALGAAGASMQTGDWRNATAGTAQIAGLRQEALDTANARAMKAWQDDSQRQAQEAAANAKAAQERQRASAVLGVYQRAVANEPPDSPFAAEAEAAARAGDMSHLAKLDAAAPLRQAARKSGLDPDAWDTAQRLQENLAAEIKRQNEALDWRENGRAQLEDRAAVEREAAIAQQEELRRRALGPYAPPKLESPEHAAAVAGAVEQARAKYREQTGKDAKPGRLGESNGRWYWISPPDEVHPKGFMQEVDGQPANAGNLVYFSVDGTRYVQNKDVPQLGALEVPLHEKGDKGAPTLEQITAAPRPRPAPTGAPPAPPAPNRAPAANHWRNLVEDALVNGGTKEQALARLRAVGVQDGFSPEQILENAMARARARGWKG